MSDLMLNDSLRINNINPFWDEPPGAWSKPYKYTPTVQNTIEQEQPGPVDPRGVEYRCKLDRPLYPKRNIDSGFWTLCRDTVKSVKYSQPAVDRTLLVFLVIVLLVLFLSYME